jgi:hypothetical protein
MRTFETHTDFEEYWNGTAAPTKPIGVRKEDSAFLVYFTASWSGACRRLDIDEIEAAAKSVGLPIWKVEQTTNDLTAGFCDVISLPTFGLIKDKSIGSRLSCYDTESVVSWIKTHELKK